MATSTSCECCTPPGFSNNFLHALGTQGPFSPSPSFPQMAFRPHVSAQHTLICLLHCCHPWQHTGCQCVLQARLVGSASGCYLQSRFETGRAACVSSWKAWEACLDVADKAGGCQAASRCPILSPCLGLRRMLSCMALPRAGRSHHSAHSQDIPAEPERAAADLGGVRGGAPQPQPH